MQLIAKLAAFAMIGMMLHLGELVLFAADETDAPEKVISISATEIERYKKDFADRIGRLPLDAEVQAFIDNQAFDLLLVAEALRIGLHQKDDVVNARIYKNVSFLSLDGNHGFNSSLKDDMIAKDLVVQRRLLERMKALITANAIESKLLDSELAEYYQQHTQNYLSAKRYRIKHQFIENNELADSAQPIQFFDEKAYITVANLRALLPKDLVDQIEALNQPGAVDTHISSAGEHHVEILQIAQPKALAFELVKSAVKQDYLKSKKELAIAEYISSIKPFYRVVIDG